MTGIWLNAAVILLGFTAIFLWLRARLAALSRDFPQTVVQETQLRLADLLQKPILDLTERLTEGIARSGGEMRETMAERLGKHFLETQERLDRTLAQGRQELQTGLFRTTQSLENKFQSLEQQVGVRLETIGKSVEAKLNENLKEGFKHFEKVQQHLQAAELKLASLNTVGQSISDLNSLLKLPHLRGGFGEATLERLLADFLPIGSYELQYGVDPASTERVDAVVKLAHQVLPIDSKFPREAVLPLFETQDPTKLEEAQKALYEYVRAQAKSIAKKYIRPEHGTTDMAMLFLPSETLYFEVIRNGKLFEEISKLKVYPVSPNTLAIGLRSVTMAQEYYDMARGVEKTIEDITKARKHFDRFETRFDEIGKSLRRAQEAYDTAHSHLGHYETSVYRLVGETPAEGPAPQLESPRPPAE
jgi:DNA recombination protein RmuC